MYVHHAKFHVYKAAALYRERTWKSEFTCYMLVIGMLLCEYMDSNVLLYM